MHLRSSRQRKPPERLNYYATALNAEHFVSDTPKSNADIEGRSDSMQWYNAVKIELNSLMKNKSWNFVEQPSGISVVDSKWEFKRRLDVNGNPGEYKARVVARGFSQRKVLDFEEAYSPVFRIETY